MLKGKHGAMMGETLYSLLLAIFATTPSDKNYRKMEGGRDGKTHHIQVHFTPWDIFIVCERTLNQIICWNFWQKMHI